MSTLDLEHAYDGLSKRRPRRALKPLERDILCRVLDDIVGHLRTHGTPYPNGVEVNVDDLMFACEKHGIRMYAHEVRMLIEIRDVINPRSDR
jgi:hypothetical protein